MDSTQYQQFQQLIRRSDEEFDNLTRQVKCPACGKLTLAHFGRGLCLSCNEPLPKKLLEEIGFDFSKLQKTPTPEINMDTTQDNSTNWADRTTPTNRISNSLTPTSARHIPTENPNSPPTSNPDVTMISPSSQIQKTPKTTFTAWKGCPAIPRAQTQPAKYPRRSYAEVINKSNSQNINPTLPRSQEVTSQRPNNRRPQPPQPTLIDELNDIKELKNHLNDLKEIKELLIEFPNILNAIRLSKKAKSKQEKLLIFIDALIAEEPTP
ncbi:hypothetical protein HNY73_019636 [Argiope bruennichi]|uniref:Uncharacterized protein n=1 Tax=Argiope bruennichi TaxID=94029 RepID=A0A8T0E5A9_ARGBR|nr:hypothetical protein HNY73_019636 [Argiope bruennichi]